MMIAAGALLLAGCEAAGTPSGPLGSASADQYEPDDSRGSATVLAESSGGADPTWQVHTLHTSSDVDWIEIEITDASGNFYLNIAPVPENDPAQGVGDIDFDLETSAGTVILSGISAFGNSTESNVLTNGNYSTGTHYVRVFAADSSTGTYQISWYTN